MANVLNQTYPIPVADGGLGVASLVTAYGILCAGTTPTGAVQTVATLGSAGQVLTSQGAASLPTWSTISQQAVVDQTSNSVTMSANTIYVNSSSDGATQVVYTLPATAAVGDRFAIVGKSTGGWVLNAATGQVINVGSTPTSAAGSVTNDDTFDGIEIICITQDTDFSLLGNVSHNYTVA